MQVKRFVAADMRRALELVRQEPKRFLKVAILADFKRFKGLQSAN
jgi:hypothetical protein